MAASVGLISEHKLRAAGKARRRRVSSSPSCRRMAMRRTRRTASKKDSLMMMLQFLKQQYLTLVRDYMNRVEGQRRQLNDTFSSSPVKKI